MRALLCGGLLIVLLACAAVSGNARARAFYERQGFQPVSRTDGDNEEQLPDILYRWRAREMQA